MSSTSLKPNANNSDSSTKVAPDHATYGPSGLKPIAQCGGYIGRGGTNAMAERGTRIHEAIEHRDPTILLDEEEVGIYEMCCSGETQLLERHVGSAWQDITPGEEENIHREVRLDIKLDGDLKTFGTLDVVKLSKDATMAVAIDFKTGRWPVEEPESNWQARAYVIGLFQKFQTVEHIYFYFLCPVREEILSGVFERSDIDLLKRMISKVIVRAMEIRPKWLHEDPAPEELNPNDHCQFCANQHMCPAIGGVAVEIAQRYDNNIDLPKGTMHSSDVDDPAKLSQMLAVAKVVDKWAASVKSHANQFVNDGNDLPGWKSRSMGALRSITDAAAIERLATIYGVSNTELIDARKYDLKKLRESVRKSAPARKKQSTENRFLEEGEEAGVIKKSATRFTLISTRK